MLRYGIAIRVAEKEMLILLDSVPFPGMLPRDVTMRCVAYLGEPRGYNHRERTCMDGGDEVW